MTIRILPRATATVLTITPCNLTAQGLEQFLTAWGFTLLGNHCSIENIVAILPPIPEGTVVLVDFVNSEQRDETYLRCLRRLGCKIKILVIAKSLTEEAKLKILRCGGHGYVETSQDLTYLRRAIEELASGGQWFERRVLFAALEKSAEDDEEPTKSLFNPQRRSHGKLTNRERAVVDLVRFGLRNKEIARKLNISEKTVKLHLNSTFRKLNISSRVQLCILFQEPELQSQAPPIG